jgi:hypothetical protein
MIRIALCLWFVWATAALAAPVQVKAGEHNGFTRLVVDYGKAVQWQVGRTEDGYELRVEGAQPDYDFTDSFKTIGTSRLVSLWADPDTGVMRIGVACACHAIPFEFRSGIIVMDLRNGPPPKGSSFEERLPALPKKPLQPEVSPPMADGPGFDWRKDAIATLSGRNIANTPQPAVAEPPKPSPLDALRNTLIGQISQGASQGLIEIAPLRLPKTEAVLADTGEHQTPDPAPKAPPHPEKEFSAVRSALGELPAVSISKGAPQHQNLGAKGENCLKSDALDVAGWRGEAAVADEMQRATQDIIGEFDRVDLEALKKAVEFYLSVGFGAEAEQLMKAFPSDLPEVPMWQALAALVDGQVESNGYFNGQMGCDSPAALWAILENDQIAKGDFINNGAAYFAFSELPIDLRRSLGPSLAERFLAIGDEAMATKVRAAILRAPGEAGPDIGLMDAAIDMHGGQTAEAEQKLQKIVDDSGPSSGDALVALIEAKVSQNLPVDKDLVEILAAMVQERDSTTQAAPTRRALILAEAASGDFSQALKGAEAQPELSSTIWRLLSRLGSDDQILSHAVLPQNSPPPTVEPETRLKLVSRLFDLGLPEAARQWITNEAQIEPLLLAKIDLAQRDATAAIRLLATQEGPDARALQATALQQLGDNTEAAKAFAEIGKTDSALQASSHAQDWQDLRQNGSGNWQALAEAATSASASAELESAPLSYGNALLGQTAATRDAVQALLQQVALP